MDPTIVSALTGFVTAGILSIISHSLILRRLRREKIEEFRIEFYQKQLTAYQKFWSLLRPTSKYHPADDLLLTKEEDGFYLNVNNVRAFFTAFRDFFYSEYGLFLSKELRTAIFNARDFLEELIAEGVNPSDHLIPLSNTKVRKINSHFDWIRTTARNDVGLRDIAIPDTELDLGSG